MVRTCIFLENSWFIMKICLSSMLKLEFKTIVVNSINNVNEK